MNHEYSCEMMEDLIPLCAENLCSEESKAAVQAHIKTCESCRKLYEHALQPPEIPANKAVPDETKTFWKVTRKIMKSRRLNKILGILLGIIAVPVAVLTLGSVIRYSAFPSFESVQQTIEVRRIVKQLAAGNFDGYLELCNYIPPEIGLNTDEWDALKNADRKLLEDCYQELFSDKTLKKVRVMSWYDWFYGMSNGLKINHKQLNSFAKIEYDDGTHFELWFARNDAFGYSCIALDYDGEDGDTENNRVADQFFNVLCFVDDHTSQNPIIFERIFENPESAPNENRIEMMASRFAPEYESHFTEVFTDFYAQGYVTTDLTLSDPHFDAERSQIYYEVTLTAADAQGSAILKTRLIDTPDMLLPPDLEMCEVYTDGCTDELADALLHFFAY